MKGERSIIRSHAHSVGLVEDEVSDAAQVGDSALQVIDQTARRGDDDLHAVAQVAHLRVLRHPAVDAGVLDLRRPSELVALLFDLQSQLASGGEDQHDGSVSALKKGLQQAGRQGTQQVEG